MLNSKLQERVREKVYSVIDDLSDEFELNIDCYPEVYFLHKNFGYDQLGLPERDRECFEEAKKYNRGTAYHRPKIIFLTTTEEAIIGEEAGHFIHFRESNITFSRHNEKDLIAIYPLTEMWGFFFSKLIDPSRENEFREIPDLFEIGRRESENIQKINEARDNWIYKQGYGLGERLYNGYISGEISKERIRKLLRKKFENHEAAFEEFLELKYIELNHEFV